MKRVLVATTVLAVSTITIGIAASQVVLPGQPHARFGDGVTPAYEGWFDGPDGARNLLFGYYNRNSEQADARQISTMSRGSGISSLSRICRSRARTSTYKVSAPLAHTRKASDGSATRTRGTRPRMPTRSTVLTG